MTAAGALPLTYIHSAVRRDRTNTIALVLACVIFGALSAYLAVRSESDLEADATTHFLIARFAFREPHQFTSVWGRPLCTATYALPAQIGTVEQGRLAARLTSLGLAFAVAFVTYAIARRQGFRRPALVAILTLAQPVFFLHSFSELTEIPFAVILMLAFLAYQRRRWLAMAALVSLLPLGRPEGFGFICMAAAALVAHRRLRWLWLLPIPFLAWNYAGAFIEASRAGLAHPWWHWFARGHWLTWVFRNWPYSIDSMYGRGPLLSFLARLPVLVGPLIFPFTLIGLAMELRWLFPDKDRHRFHWLRTRTHEQRCEMWIVIVPLAILIVHSILWWRGKMGSNGELRYLVIVGPFFALAGARGWEWAWQRFEWRAPLLWAGVAAVAPASVNLFYKVVPFQLYEEGIVSRQVARWYRADPRLRDDFPRIIPTLPQIYFDMDLSQNDVKRTLTPTRFHVASAPPGTLLIWDPIYGAHNSDANMCNFPEDIARAGWIHYRRFACKYPDGVTEASADVYLSPRTASGAPTSAQHQSAK
jgi:hypothetical protein